MRKLPVVLELSAKVCAVLGGALLTLVTLLTCASVIGRNLLDVTMVGDFELTGVASGLAVALFMPWCQSRRGNILVDFFTSRASAKTNAKLDRLGALAVCALMGALAWRTALGGLNAWDNHSGSMLLGFPDWVVYFGMVPPLLLTALIALWQCLAPPAYTQAGA